MSAIEEMIVACLSSSEIPASIWTSDDSSLVVGPVDGHSSGSTLTRSFRSVSRLCHSWCSLTPVASFLSWTHFIQKYKSFRDYQWRYMSAVHGTHRDTNGLDTCKIWSRRICSRSKTCKLSHRWVLNLSLNISWCSRPPWTLVKLSSLPKRFSLQVPLRSEAIDTPEDARICDHQIRDYPQFVCLAVGLGIWCTDRCLEIKFRAQLSRQKISTYPCTPHSDASCFLIGHHCHIHHISI